MGEQNNGVRTSQFKKKKKGGGNPYTLRKFMS